MTIESFQEIVDFIRENRGDSSFINMSIEDINDIVIMALNTDTCIIHRGKDKEIDGCFFWDIKKYIPLKIEITQCISKGRWILIDMLREFGCLVPINFLLYAKRKKMSKTINYNNPRRLLRLIERQCYGKR
jgi:hypothetical protein